MKDKSSQKKFRQVSIFAIICVFSLIVCSAHQALAKDEILIGTHQALSGPLSTIATEQLWTYEMAVEDVNKEGGIYVKEYGKKLPVRLICIDDETDAGKASQAVERLVKRKKVDLILGGHSAAFGTIPGCVAAEKFKKYYHATACLIEPWVEFNFKWSTLYFFVLDQATANPFIIWDSLPEEERPKKPAQLMEDTFDGEAFSKLFRNQAEKFGYKFAMDESLAVGAKDFSAQVIKAKTIGVDAILIFCNSPVAITFLRQMKENKFSVPYMQGWKATWMAEFWDGMGGKDAQYILLDGFWSEDWPYPGAKELGQRYHKKFNRHSAGVGAFYALCQTLFQAIENAGTLDSAKVRQSVIDSKFDITVNGEVDYDERGVAVFLSPAFQWWNGKQMPVYPFDRTTYKLKLAPPWNER